MIKFTAMGKDGRKVLWLGLSFGNLKHFRDHPGDTFIKVDGTEFGVDFDVLLFSGRTEQEMMRDVADMIGPNTKATFSKKVTDA